MKKARKILSLVLAALIVFTCIPFSVTAEGEVTYKVGDIIEYGNYPQSCVTDEALIAELDGVAKDWQSLNYYSGTGLHDGKMTPSDYMKYADIEYNGARYRAIHFTKYRPYLTREAASTSTTYTFQHNNGYYINTTYYFKFEPLKWRVLDPDTGFIMCESIIDSQAYQNTIYQGSGEHYHDSTQSVYTNDYAQSSIRKWLNNDFYNAAFSSSQKANIETTALNNDCTINSKYNSAPTNDKIFLLSYDEAKTSAYGFSSSPSGNDHARSAQGTDYAKCQGLWVNRDTGSSYDGNSKWLLRSPGRSSIYALGVDYDGHSYDYYGDNVNDTYRGVRPACRLATLKSDTESPEVKPTEKNYTWEYDGSGHLYINGTGSINAAPDYGWEKYADEITYIEVSDGITNLPENVFSNMPYLSEVYFGSDVAEISTGAFSDCPLLTVATFNGNTAIGSGAFANANQNLTFILNGNTDAPKAFAEQNGIKTVAANYDAEKKTLNFIGDITVFDYTKYNALHNILYQFADSEYLYFTKLIFADTDPNINIKDDALDAENTPNGLILNNVYISLILLKDGTEQGVSFARMLELLESGEYDVFKYKLESDEKEEEGTLFERIERFIKRALQFISKLINFIKRLFKRF